MPKGRDKEADNKWALDLLKKNRYSPEWWKKSSGRAELTDSPIDMALLMGPAKAGSIAAKSAADYMEKMAAKSLVWDGLSPIGTAIARTAQHTSVPLYSAKQLSDLSQPSNNVDMKKQYCHGGKMYFLGSDLSFTDYMKNNPQGISAIGAAGAGVIDAVDKPGGSMAGSLGKGALSGAASGAMFGPIGMGVGAALGAGMGFMNQRKSDKLADIAYNQQSLSNYAAGTQGIDPSMHNYKLGGPLLTTFSGGGTHEQNPNGGIQQGINRSNGEPNLVEADETKSNAPGSKDYIFPARTIFTNPKEYNLGGSLAGLSFADASKKIAKYSDERPNDPIAAKDYELKTVRLKQANEDEIAMREFQNQNPQDKVTHVNSQDKLGSKMFKCGGFIFKDY